MGVLTGFSWSSLDFFRTLYENFWFPINYTENFLSRCGTISSSNTLQSVSTVPNHNLYRNLVGRGKDGIDIVVNEKKYQIKERNVLHVN